MRTKIRRLSIEIIQVKFVWNSGINRSISFLPGHSVPLSNCRTKDLLHFVNIFNICFSLFSWFFFFFFLFFFFFNYSRYSPGCIQRTLLLLLEPVSLTLVLLEKPETKTMKNIFRSDTLILFRFSVVSLPWPLRANWRSQFFWFSISCLLALSFKRSAIFGMIPTFSPEPCLLSYVLPTWNVAERSHYSVFFFCYQAILDTNARGHKLIIMDARPKINALANQVFWTDLEFCKFQSLLVAVSL